MSSKNEQVERTVQNSKVHASLHTAMMKIEVKGYLIAGSIGGGTSGRVCMAERLSDGLRCCVKYIPADLTDLATDKRHIVQEVQILREIHHPGIVEFIDFHQDESGYYIFMEHLPGMNLLDYINKQNAIPEDECQAFFAQIVDVLACLHSKNIAHRDLKPENIIVVSRYKLKVIDFGLSSVSGTNGLLTTFCGSIHYAAPECLLQVPYVGSCVDIWAAGVILYAMICGTLPWHSNNVHNLIVQITNCAYKIPLNVPPSIANIISLTLVIDPQQRPTAEQLLVHPWVESYLVKYSRQVVHNQSLPYLPRILVPPNGSPRSRKPNKIVRHMSNIDTAPDSNFSPPSLLVNDSIAPVALSTPAMKRQTRKRAFTITMSNQQQIRVPVVKHSPRV